MSLPPPYPASLLYRAPRGLANMLSAAAVAGDRHRIAAALRLGRRHCARDVARDLRCYVHWIGLQRRSCPAPFACRPGESSLRPFEHTRAGREYAAKHATHDDGGACCECGGRHECRDCIAFD